MEIDRAILNREIEAIFFTEPSRQDAAARNFPSRELVQDDVETLIRAGRRGEVRQAAERLIAILSLDLDDLRKAALLSLIVRLTGKQNFDPVAAYVLENCATYVANQG